jgi:uncharacterized membrane protein SpoIIM required for sporulation
MNQEQFVQQHRAHWERLEAVLAAQGRKDRAALEPDQVAAFAHDYRRLCHELALARARGYSRPLIARLSALALQGHQLLYQRRSGFWLGVGRYLAAGFPQAVRREWRVVTLAALLFFGPFLGMIAAIQIEPDLALSVMDASQLRQMEEMYEPSLHSRLGREREADSDVLMFGFYLRNNTSIGFQTFAGGLLFGLGTLFFLIYNGLVIGTVAGHLTELGYIETFWGFVSGHSAFELTAIALSGAAGLKLGAALIAPGRRTRARALLDAGREAMSIVYGAALLFLLAAFVEAFWSSMAGVPAPYKYAVGIALWVLTLAYLALFGRTRRG